MEESKDFRKPAEPELRACLTPQQFEITQREGTEAPFRNEFWNHHEPGIYVDVVSGEPLFSSQHKFDSGTGWPSFSQPLVKGGVVEREDRRLGIRRTEVRSRRADSHLGHRFDDGPAPTGQRYCINSAALRFVPASRLAEQGYGQFRAPFEAAGLLPRGEAQSGPSAGASGKDGASSASEALATVAGGCFWGVEHLLRELPGVLGTEVGYTGGHTERPTYKEVCSGKTGHAEAVQIRFDPTRVAYEDVLRYFFRLHDPTTLNRQHNDVGTQYRSAVFVHDEQQRAVAERVLAEEERSGRWKQPVVTQIVPAERFWPAEDYHQEYLVKNPEGYNCHFLRD